MEEARQTEQGHSSGRDAASDTGSDPEHSSGTTDLRELVESCSWVVVGHVCGGATAGVALRNDVGRLGQRSFAYLKGEDNLATSYQFRHPI